MAAVWKVFSSRIMSLKYDLRTRFITKSTSIQLFPLLSIASGHQNSVLLDFTDWSASNSMSLVYDARKQNGVPFGGKFLPKFASLSGHNFQTVDSTISSDYMNLKTERKQTFDVKNECKWVKSNLTRSPTRRYQNLHTVCSRQKLLWRVG